MIKKYHSLKNKYIDIIFFITFSTCISTLSFTDQGNISLPSEDITTCFVSPRILCLMVECGRVRYGEQVPYMPKPGDEIREEGIIHALYRNGTYHGALAGKDKNIIFLPDTLIIPSFTPERGTDRTQYLMFSDSDDSYKKGQLPVKIYRKSRPTGIARTGTWTFDLPVQHIYYLVFDHPFKKGNQYKLTCPENLFPDIAFSYIPELNFSEAVHVNQVGFRPDDIEKTAFLSCWMGTGGGLVYESPLYFELLENNTNTPVYKGKVILALKSSEGEDAYKINYSKTNVYSMDFSDFSKPGIYRVFVEGIGCSFPFEIGSETWKNAFIISTRGFFHQRSGIKLGPPYTTYIRPRCFHEDDGVIVYASKAGLMETGNGLNREDSNFGNLVAGLTSEKVNNAWGGYMDAGDWDRRIQHLEVTRLLFELYALFPGFFSRVKLNIPESSNELPDIIDEALFNIDCYRRMQLKDGGIRGGIESEEHPRYGEASWQESLHIIAYAPDPWSGYIFAGTAAHCSRILQSIDKTLASTYQQSAVRAFEWSEKRISEITPEQKYKNGIRDVRNCAAADLYRLTGDKRYHTIFLSTTVFTKHGQELTIWEKHDQRHAAWVYARTTWTDVDKKVQNFCREALFREADERLASTKKAGFRWAKFAWSWPSFGVFSASDGVSLVRAYILSGHKKYLSAIINAAQHGAGANPLNLCYTTGVGKRWPRNPLHVDSRISCQEPPAGLTVCGPMDYFVVDKSDVKWCMDIVEPYIYPHPRDWPALESYWDVYWFPAQCEYTVQDPMARNAYVWGFLAAR